MFETPSWLTPPNYLAAMQGGAGIGLHQREQDFAEQHAADALRESYAHLASQQAIAQQGFKASAARQQAALELRKSQLDALENYRQDRTDQADQRISQAGTRISDLSDINKQRLADQQQRMNDLQTQRDFMNEYRTHEADRRDKEADRPRQAHYFTGPDYKQYMVPPGGTNAVPVNMPSPATAPAGPSLAHRAGVWLGLVNDQPTAKKLTKVKGPNGQTGTVPEGTTLPDGWTTQ